MSAPLNPTDLHTRLEETGVWKMRITSFRLGRRFVCTVDDFDPGAVLARSEAASREEAEDMAVGKAREMLEGTRTFH